MGGIGPPHWHTQSLVVVSGSSLTGGFCAVAGGLSCTGVVEGGGVDVGKKWRLEAGRGRLTGGGRPRVEVRKKWRPGVGGPG